MPSPTQFLLDTWHAVAARRAGAVAMVDAGSGRHWSFADLRDAAQAAAERAAAPGVVCPRGQGPDFVVDVLAAWEAGRLICPLDSGMEPPPAASWHGLREVYPDAVLAKTTSGSTGAPRHVMFDAAQLAADADAIVRTMGLSADRPNVAAISLAHSYGFSNLVLPLLLHGIPLVVAASPLPDSIRAALGVVARGETGGTRATLPGVPALWRAWHAAGVVDATHVATALSAGAPLPLDLEHQVHAETGVKIHNFLGSSECGGIAYDRSPAPRKMATLAGTALDGVSLSVDAAGRLLVRSPAVGLGYWPPEAEPNADTDGADDGPALRPGVFRTGDLAEERDGAWHLLGRAADTINLAGRKLHPMEIESLLRTHHAVRECLVFGIPSTDAARGEEVVAAVAVEDDDPSVWRDLPAWLGAQLPAWKRPRHWWPRPDLAATARGKLPRAEWRRRFLAQSR